MDIVKTKQLTIRYIVFLIGVIINSFGIAFITKAALGTSPISSVPYVLSLKFEPSFGTISFVFNLFFIVGQIILLKKDFEKIQILQLLVNFIFSIAIDVSMYILTFLAPTTLIQKIIFVVVGCAILGFGITVEVAPRVLMVPGEGIVQAITDVSHKKFGNVKICFDVTLMTSALILSIVFFRGLNGIGIGSIISAFMVGAFVKIFKETFGEKLGDKLVFTN